MKVLVAGASGVVGKRLIPALAARGHSVVGQSTVQPGAPHLPASWCNSDPASKKAPTPYT